MSENIEIRILLTEAERTVTFSVDENATVGEMLYRDDIRLAREKMVESYGLRDTLLNARLYPNVDESAKIRDWIMRAKKLSKHTASIEYSPIDHNLMPITPIREQLEAGQVNARDALIAQEKVEELSKKQRHAKGKKGTSGKLIEREEFEEFKKDFEEVKGKHEKNTEDIKSKLDQLGINIQLQERKLDQLCIDIQASSVINSYAHCVAFLRKEIIDFVNSKTLSNHENWQELLSHSADSELIPQYFINKDISFDQWKECTNLFIDSYEINVRLPYEKLLQVVEIIGKSTLYGNMSISSSLRALVLTCQKINMK